VEREIISYFGLRHPVAAGTHFVAFVLSAFGTYLLWRRGRGCRWIQFVACSFGVSMMLLYAASATWHALQLPWAQMRYLLLVDKIAIFVLIAGTYTPVVLFLVRHQRRRIAFFAAIWLLAAGGIALKVLAFVGAIPHEPYWIGVVMYLAMGWLALGLLLDMVRTVGFRGMRWAVYGGLAYSLGAVIDVQQEPNIWPGVFGPHELFHVLAMIGTFCHFVFIWRFVLPYANDTVSVRGGLAD
jgi:hemolysin III